jgi:hypothetical protein
MESAGGRLFVPAYPGRADCDAVALLRTQIHEVHQLLDEHVAAATERAQSSPALQREILSLYAHALCVEDVTVNLLLRAASPVFKQTWIGGQLAPWDLTSVQGYAEVVHAATDVLLARLTAVDLRLPIDLSDVGLGSPDAVWVLNRFILWQTVLTCGELAAKRPETRRTAASHRALPTHELAGPASHSNGVHRPSGASTNGVASADPSLVKPEDPKGHTPTPDVARRTDGGLTIRHSPVRVRGE